MFKAKLIENESYYKLRSRQLLLFLLPSVLAGFIANFYLLPVWATIIAIGLYTLIIILTIRSHKQMKSISGDKSLEIDEHEIRIKSSKGKREEVIKLNEVEKIILKEEYSIPQETMKEIGQELAGSTKQNYLIIQQNSRNRRLDFGIESYYMIKQLNKLIKNWESKGYEIERLTHK